MTKTQEKIFDKLKQKLLDDIAMYNENESRAWEQFRKGVIRSTLDIIEELLEVVVYIRFNSNETEIIKAYYYPGTKKYRLTGDIVILMEAAE